MEPVKPVSEDVIKSKYRSRPSLTKVQVWEIRNKYLNNRDATCTSLSDEYGVSIGTINKALRGLGTYKNI